MDTKKALLYVSAAAALALGIVFVQLSERLNVERARAESEVSQRRDAQQRLEGLERRLAQATPVQADVAAVETSPEPAARQAPATQEKERDTRMPADAESREVVDAARKAEVRARNPDMAREIGLSDEEFEQLLDLMITLQRTSVPIDEQSRAVAEFLGEEKAARFETYKRRLPLRWQVHEFRSLLTEASALTDAQAARLTAALQSNRERFAEEFAAQSRTSSPGALKFAWYGIQVSADDDATDGATIEQGVVEQLQRYQERMRESAASVLTADQLRVYEQFMQDQLATQRSQVRWKVARYQETRGRGR